MLNTSFDYTTFFYKIFLLILIATQIYSLTYYLGDMFTLTVNAILLIYFTFRFYLLVKLSKRANRLALSLPIFLEKCYCDKCCNKCDCDVKT